LLKSAVNPNRLENLNSDYKQASVPDWHMLGSTDKNFKDFCCFRRLTLAH